MIYCSLKSVKVLLVVSIVCICSQSKAEKIQIAVASNFAVTMLVIADKFELSTGHQVILIVGSTGKHYAQIKHGAPFDIFFAADAARPHRLEKEGLAQPNTRFTYAVGQLVLWSRKSHYIDSEASIMQSGDFQHLAIANPKLAPYGKAAQEVLEQQDLWHKLSRRMVRGENINQTFQFVTSGNAELGFVAYSQVKRLAGINKGSFWKVPQALYTPIKQQAILLKDKKAARQFLLFIRSKPMLKIINEHGYHFPVSP